ncbi:MAG: hypothetical protein KDA22_08950 [Phycisphaerales bacterium]|nr:hypothetical protein [Phycisphaerales bacterium]
MATRVLVDGIDYRNAFWFPRVLGAVTASMQPPRLVVGLLLVAVLLVAGRLHDRWREPAIAPGGLLAPAASPESIAAHSDLLRRALVEYVPAERRPDLQESRLLEAGAVLELARSGYRERRAAMLREGGGDAWPSIAESDARFLEMVERIESSRPKGTFEALVGAVVGAINRIAKGTLTLRLDEAFGGLGELFIRVPLATLRADAGFFVGYGLLFILATSILGGALARMAACDFARREKLGVAGAGDFAVASWRSLLLASLVPLVLTTVLCLLVLMLGLIMTVPGLDILGAVLYGAALLLGFLAAFLLLGYAISYPLLVPAVACERCDAGEAQQRAVAYLLARPLHLAGYFGLGIVGFAIGYIVISGMAVVTLNLTAALFSLLTTNSAATGLGGFELFALAPRPPLVHTGTAALAGAMTEAWQSLVIGIVAAWVFSYYYAATTRIYLLMRHAVDGEDPVEIWREGMVPGTHIAMPTGPDEPVEPGPGLTERAVQSTMRAIAAARTVSRPFRTRTEVAEPDAKGSASAPDGDATGRELGPELIPEDDRRTGLRE